MCVSWRRKGWTPDLFNVLHGDQAQSPSLGRKQSQTAQMLFCLKNKTQSFQHKIPGATFIWMCPAGSRPPKPLGPDQAGSWWYDYGDTRARAEALLGDLQTVELTQNLASVLGGASPYLGPAAFHSLPGEEGSWGSQCRQ